MKPLIFISHSAKDREVARPIDEGDPAAVRRREILRYAQSVRDAIVSALDPGDTDGQTRFNVWLDRDTLRGGEDWDAEIEDALRTCDGAVILLDEVSVSSYWVHHEAEILMHRRRSNPRLLVIPVFLGEFRSGLLEEPFWKPIRLASRQSVRLDTDEMSETTALALATRVAKRFDGLTREDDDTPRGRWVADVGNVIGKVPVETQVSAAALIGIGLPEWESLSVGHVTLAYRLLRSSLKEATEPLSELLRAMDSEYFALRLIARVLPIWVNEEAGRQLHANLESDTPQVIILNVRSRDSARDYLLRAYDARPEKWAIVEVVKTTGAAAEEVLRDIDQALRDECSEGDDDLGEEDWDSTRLAEVLVLLGPNAARPDVEAVLRQKYPTARFLVLSGPNHTLAAGQLARALLLEPLARDADESEASSARRKLRRVVTGERSPKGTKQEA